MELALATKIFDGNLENIFYSVTKHGIRRVHLSMSTISSEEVPSKIDYVYLDEIKQLCKENNIEIVSVSGTFNMIDLNTYVLSNNINNFENICKIANLLDIPIISLCTGSRNIKSKWLWSEENKTQKAWGTLLNTTSRLLELAREYNVILGVEPEPNNIICDSEVARRYLDIYKSPNLKIIMDGANLITSKNYKNMKYVFDHSFNLLGHDICLAHAKDVLVKDDGVTYTAAGEGILEYDYYIRKLREFNYDGTIVLHSLKMYEIEKSIKYLEGLYG